MNVQIKHSLTQKILYWLLLTLMLLTSACSREEPAPSQTSAKPGPQVVRVGLALQPQSALALIAREKGYFKAHGLNIEFHEFPSGKRALNEGLYAGRVDMATASDLPVAMAALNEKKFTILATTFNASNINRVIARRDAGITVPADLHGKHVATQKASAVHYFLHLFMLENSLDEKALKLSFMKAEQLPQALAEGKIDAFSMREPYISEAKDLLGENAITFAAPGIYSQVDVALITPQLHKERPAAVKAILAALLDAEKFVNSNPAEAVKIVATALGAPVSNIEQIWPGLNLQLRLEQALLLLLESESRWAIRHAYTDATEVPDFMLNIDYSPLEILNPDAVTLIH